MKVSIVVPIYNLEKYIGECIKSILNQSYTDFELILVDDGSIDKSLSICREYEKQDSKIKVITGENAGVSSARNKGIEIADGECITFVDGDDRVDPNWLKALVFDMKRDKKIIISCCKVKETDNFSGEIVSEYKENDFEIGNKNELLASIINWSGDCAVYNKLFYKEKIGDLRFIGKATEDKLFNVKYLAKNEGLFSQRSDELYLYYKRENSASRITKFDEKFFQIVDFSEETAECVKDKTDYIKDCALYNIFRSKLLLIDFIASAEKIGEYKKQFTEYKNYMKKNKSIAEKFGLPKNQQRVLKCISVGTNFLKLFIKLKKLKSKLR